MHVQDIERIDVKHCKVRPAPKTTSIHETVITLFSELFRQHLGRRIFGHTRVRRHRVREGVPYGTPDALIALLGWRLFKPDLVLTSLISTAVHKSEFARDA